MLFDKLKELSQSEQLAAFDGTEEMTFAQLWKYSEAMALFLEEKNSSKPVLLFGDKENRMFASIVGCVKSSTLYVPVPSYYPTSRVLAILENSEAELVINASASTPFPECSAEVISGNDFIKIEEKYAGQKAPEDRYIHEGCDFCILYTSGSTGTPKGVLLTYDNLIYNSDFFEDFFVQNAPFVGCRSINFSAYSFSASLGTIFYVNVNNGATVYSIPRNVLVDVKTLVARLIEINPHRLLASPALLNMLLSSADFTPENLPVFSILSMGGEALPAVLARRFKERFPKVTFLLGYGTTETSGGPTRSNITFELLDELDALGEKYVPIGKPYHDGDAFLMDENGNIIEEDNVPGEVILTGICVSKGYYKRPDLTDKAFFTLPDGRRCYHTRDIAKRINGLLYFIGRVDNQVKVNGNRIELEDVEAHLRLMPNVRECAVAVKEGEQNSLVAFIVLRDKSGTNMQNFVAVKKWMRESVQAYMIPSKILFVDAIPKNMNLKIDRPALHKLAQEV